MGNESLEPFFNEKASEPDGTKRNIRIQSALNPIEGYHTSDTDINPQSTSFYGFLDKDGKWYIMKAIESGTETNWTYESGDSGYATAWTGRAALTYQRFSDEF